MKIFLLHPLIVTFWSVAGLLALPMILPEPSMPSYSPDELRKVAKNAGFKSIPTSYDELLKAVDNPDNPMTPAKIALGKQLFFDPVLSRDKTINCASCHILESGGDDNSPVAVGYHDRANPHHLNSPTVLNSALAVAQFWDGRAVDVEEQAGGPVQAPFEMNMTPEEVEKRLNAIKGYKDQFAKVFGDSNISFENVRKSIGAYERTLLTRGPIDEFLDGNNSAISKKAQRGFALFINKGCKVCHAGMAFGGSSIQKFPLRHTFEEYLGLAFVPKASIKESPFPFENKGGFLGRGGRLEFRVPILRNITQTSPYFHNGAVKEIEEVVRLMSKYQIGDEFDKDQIDDVVEFLKTLEGKIVDY